MVNSVDIPHPDAALSQQDGRITDTWWRALKQIAQLVNSTSGASADSSGLAAHIADPIAAHAATAISFAPNGTIGSTNVQAAIQEVRDEALSALTSTGIHSVEEDTSPSLGGDLDLNGRDITGAGNIDIAGSATVLDDAYDAATWNANLTVPTKNAIRDKVESVIAGTRELLTTDRVYYVRTDGSDANDGLTNSAGGAWATITHAWKTICSTLDLGGHGVTVTVGAGTFAGGFSTFGDVTQPPDDALTNGYQPVGGGSVTILGAGGGSTIIESAAISDADAFDIEHPLETLLYLTDFTLDAAGSFDPIFASAPVRMFMQGVSFQNCAGFNGISGVGFGVFIGSFGTYTIAGNMDSFISLREGAEASLDSAVTVTGTPAWGDAFVKADSLSLIVSFSTFSGSATGVRYAASLNSVINTNGGGANYFPGNSAGTTATGAQYA